MNFKIRVKAPLRLGLGGGGTDVEPYCSEFGGAVFNTTIDLFAHCMIDVDTSSRVVRFESQDLSASCTFLAGDKQVVDGELDLYKHIYNAFLDLKPRLADYGLVVTTYSDVPSGSGLGGSSTLVVAIVKGFCDLLGLPWGDYEMAKFCYRLERIDAGIVGGHQDQYAACFGGFNYMEFFGSENVLVNPLRVRNWIKAEFEASMVLYFTGLTRKAAIIEEEKRNATQKNEVALAAMHQSKADAKKLKEFLLRGDVAAFAQCLENSWVAKKKMAPSVSNKFIDDLHAGAKSAGALAGKVSGAGGGGFMFFISEPEKKYAVSEYLRRQGGEVYNFHFYNDGVSSWRQ